MKRTVPKYLILFISLLLDLLILTICFLISKNHTNYLFLILAIGIVNSLFFDYCKKHIPYSKISIFYLWKFKKEDCKFIFGKTGIEILLCIIYFIFFDHI